MKFTRRKALLGTTGIAMTALSGCTDILESDPTIAAASNLDESHLGTVENSEGVVSEIWVSFSQLSVSWEGMGEPVGELEIRLILQELDELVLQHVETGDWGRGDDHEFTEEDDLGADLLEETTLDADTFAVEEDGGQETFSIPLNLEVAVRDSEGALLHSENFDLLVEFTVVNLADDEEPDDDQPDDAVGDDPNDEEEPVDDDEPPDDDPDDGEEPVDNDEPPDDDPDDEEEPVDDDEPPDDDPDDGEEPVDDDGQDDDPPDDNDEFEISGPTTIEEGGTYEVVADIHAQDTAIEIPTEEDVTIHGNEHTLEGEGTGAGIGNPIGHTTLDDLTVRGFERGIDLVGMGGALDAESLHIEDCTVGLETDMGGPISVLESTITNAETGVRLQDQFMDPATFEDCSFENCEEVMWQDQSSRTTLLSSTVANSGTLSIGGGEIVQCDLAFDSGGVLISADRAGGEGGLPTAIEQTQIETPDTAVESEYGFADLARCDISGSSGIVTNPDVRNSSVSVTYSNIAGDCVFDGTEGTIEATCNWWGDETGPVHPDNPLDDPQGETIEGDVTFEPWMTEEVDEDTDLDAACEGPIEPSMDADADIDGAVA